jgi:hypothetical protein
MGRAMIHRIIEFTPDLAAEWLAGGSLRGPLNRDRVRHYVEMLRCEGDMYGLSMPIMRCVDRRLLVRGARLAAIVETGVASRLWTIDEIPLEVAYRAMALARGYLVRPEHLR